MFGKDGMANELLKYRKTGSYKELNKPNKDDNEGSKKTGEIENQPNHTTIQEPLQLYRDKFTSYQTETYNKNIN